MYILHTVVSNLLDHKLCMFVTAALSFQVILPRPNVLRVFPGDSQVEALQPWTLLLRVCFLHRVRHHQQDAFTSSLHYAQR